MIKNLTKQSRQLRNNLTEAEKYLWYLLRGKQINDLKFRRQAQIGPYIVDFVCFDIKIIIEIDGGQHALEIADQDKIRGEWLESQGFKVLRFWNNEVLENREGVLQEVLKYCK